MTEKVKNRLSTLRGNKRWYVIQAYAGMEKGVQKALRERVDRAGIGDRFGEILVPSEEVVEFKNGVRNVTEKRLFPGYIFAEMEMDDEVWHLVKSTPKVSSFVGGVGNRPSPIPTSEVEKIRSQMQEGTDKPRPKMLFNTGELVRVKDGPFTDFNGMVDETNYEKSRVRVSVMIFGRATPIELEFGQIEKM